MNEAPVIEPVKAVIISGPRCGQIVSFPPSDDQLSDEELGSLNAALDALDSSLARLEEQFDRVSEAFAERSSTRGSLGGAALWVSRAWWKW